MEIQPGIQPPDLGNPHELLQIQPTLGERWHMIFAGKVLPEAVLSALRATNTDFHNPDGSITPYTLDTVKAYIAGLEHDDVTTNDPTIKHNAQIEQTHHEYFAIDKLYRQGNYEAIIKIFLAKAAHEFDVAAVHDQRASANTTEELKSIARADALNRTQKSPGDQGYPNEMLANDGRCQRAEGNKYMRFAAVLAKSIPTPS
jgi:hypothetical protein